jgi:hypothetical protein
MKSIVVISEADSGKEGHGTMPRKFTARDALLDLGMVGLVAAFVVLLIYQSQLAGLGSMLLLACAFAVTAIGLARDARRERRLDEVELAGASFGARWGAAAVTLLAVLTTFVAPIQHAIARFSALIEASVAVPMPEAARAFVFGILAALVIQLAARSALSAVWRWRKS